MRLTELEIADDTPKKPQTPRVPITDEERRLIDEAIEQGRVTVIPPGQSSIDEGEMSWAARRFNFRREEK